MPCSTILVSDGKFKGGKPAYFNVEIIEYLNRTRAEPPHGAQEVADLEWLKKGSSSVSSDDFLFLFVLSFFLSVDRV